MLRRTKGVEAKHIMVLDNTNIVKMVDINDIRISSAAQQISSGVEEVDSVFDITVPEVDPWMLTQTFSPVLDRNVPITPKMRKKPFFGMEFAPASAF